MAEYNDVLSDQIDKLLDSSDDDEAEKPPSEVVSIEKPKPKRGRPPLSDAQKAALAKGRMQQKVRMAKETLQKFQAERKLEKKPVEKKPVIVKKPKKVKIQKKPKREIIYETDSESDIDSESSDEPAPPPRQRMTFR
jgi:hypothetical protein